MPGLHHYLITALPSPGELGTAPPINLADLLEHIDDSDTARAIVRALVLGDDLLRREAILAGEEVDPAAAVLSAAQIRGEAPLDEVLTPEGPEHAHRVAVDATWEAYFRHVADVAAETGSRFLAEWVRHEVSMRNALVDARARSLGLEGGAYRVAPDLGGDESEFATVINEWSTAEHPLDGLRVLDRARWQWLTDHDAWFSFSADELAVYAAKLILLHRWRRIGQEGERVEGSEDGK